MPRQPRIVIQKGGLGGGRLECDSLAHFWIVPEYQQIGCREKLPCGQCHDYEFCKQLAAELLRQDQEEAAKTVPPTTAKKG